MYKVSDFSKLFNINPSVLRYYDREGIFSPEFRDPKTGYRYYTPKQIHTFSLLMEAKEGGIPLEHIKIHNHALFITDDIDQIRRDHEYFQLFLEDLSTSSAPASEYVAYAKTYPSCSVVKVESILKNSRTSLNAVQQGVQQVIKENFQVDNVHFSYVIFHSEIFSLTNNKVTLCLMVKDNGSPEITQIPRQRYLCTYHYGPSNELGNAYSFLKKQIRDRNLTISGPPSERYISRTDLQEEGTHFVIEVRFPISR